MIKSFFNRIYSDYLMSSRLDEYESILSKATDLGYEHLSIRDVITYNGPLPGNIFVHRHDIDTDVQTAKKMFELEKKYNVKASYYFRLSTLDFEFMREIESYGSEASYHFEEIATYAKKFGIKSSASILEYLPSIQDVFCENLHCVEAQLGTKILTVASHGDFANRKLGLVNYELLNDTTLRDKCGLLCESYDDELMSHFDCRISDKPYPVFYYPKSVLDALDNNHHGIYFLTHPRQWHVSYYCNTKENLVRLYEGIKWKFGSHK